MTTLASAVAIGDNQLIIDAPMAVGQVPGWVKIDSELLKVGGQHFRTGTTLVLSDPATAVHSSGAPVTYAGKPYDAAFLAATGAVAGEQTIRLLGPFTVTFETEGVGSEEDGALITTLSAGQIVVGIGVVINNAGGFDANLGIYLGGSNYEAPNDEFSRLVLDVPAATGMVPSGAARTRYKIGISSGDVAGWSGAAFGILLSDGALVAQLSDVATQGEADIYALIAEPAA